VIPAGERWDDTSLRPCLEDLIGAGAVLSEITRTLSPEGELAVAAFARFRRNLRDAIGRCESGQEPIRRGFAPDIELAAEYAVSSAAPVLAGDRFVNDGRQTRTGDITASGQ
jgi:2-phosphosulfolactate phosphatase